VQKRRQDWNEDGSFHKDLTSEDIVESGLGFECDSWSFVAFVDSFVCFRLN